MTPALDKGALGYPGRVDGIDVSEFQPTVDYKKVFNAGFRFAFVRAALGTYHDPFAEAHLDGFREAGLYALPYAAARPGDGDPKGQANALYQALGDTFPGRMALDIEARAGLTNAQLVDFCEQFIEQCETFGALEPVVYSYPYFLGQLLPEIRSSRLGRCPLWLSSFPFQPWCPGPTYVPSPPTPWTSVTVHQYSGNDGFRVPGIPTRCDRDLFLGDEESFRAWLGLPPAPDAG